MKRAPLLVLLALLTQHPTDAVCAEEAREIEVAARPVTLYTPPAPERGNRVGRLVFLSGLQLSSPDPGFGGYSGFLLSDDGSRLLAVSDRGLWLDAVLSLDAAGLPVGVAAARLAPMLDEEGRTLRGNFRDAEAVIPTGSGVLVAFEFAHRIMVYDTDQLWSFPSAVGGLVPRRLPVPREVLRHPVNGGLEAGVHLADGRLLLFSEQARADTADDRRAWLLGEDRAARPLAYRLPDAGFGATDAALLPNGDVLLLLRRFSPFSGLSVALQRIAGADIAPGARLAGEELARFEAPFTIDNMEGLAVRVDGEGRTLLYLISDDNFNIFQRTLLMVFMLAEEE